MRDGRSARLKKLLSGEETQHVEFKKSVGLVESADFVQFANSSDGGEILVGVEEVKDGNGRRMPTVVGCLTTDANKRSLLDKAGSCSPPVDITVHVEKVEGKQFYRVVIPSGLHKPYCTASGTYVIRNDGERKALLPAQLLNLFLESQGTTFVERFKEASRGIDEALKEMRSRIEEAGSATEEQLNLISRVAEHASETSDEAMSNAADAVAAIEDVSAQVDAAHNDLLESVHSANRRLKKVLKHQGISDPDEDDAEYWRKFAEKQEAKEREAAALLGQAASQEKSKGSRPLRSRKNASRKRS